MGNSRVGNGRTAAIVAWTLGVGGMLIICFALLIWAGRGFGSLPVSFGRGVIGVIGLVVAPLTYLTFGALLAARIPRNPVGWLLLGCGLLLASMLPVNLLVALAHESLKQPDSQLVAVAWLRNTFATPGVAALLAIAVYLFPDGRPTGRRWSAGIAVAIVAGLLLALGAALNPQGMLTYPTLPNPTAVPADLQPLVNAVTVTAVTLMCLAAVHAIASLASRYRSGDAVRRAQLRWIVLATMITALAAIPFLLTRYLVDVGDTLGDVAALGVQLAMSTFPIAAAAAISRYRLYDVDLLIGRTLVYVPLMAILGGLYTASSALFQRLFVAFTGQTSDVAIVLTVLVVASTFTPLRRSLEGTLERRFPKSRGLQALAAEEAEHNDIPLPQASPSTSLATVPLAQMHEISDDDLVDCPLVGAPVHLSRCLTCSRLRAITTAPSRSVVCTGSGASASSPATAFAGIDPESIAALDRPLN